MTLYDSSLELNVIGALCAAPEYMKKVAYFLKPEDFTIPACEEIYRVIYNLFIGNKPIDVALLPNALSDKITDPAKYIQECFTITPTVNNVELHSHIVHDAAKERRLRDDALNIFESCEKNAIATSLIEKCQDFLNEKSSHGITMYEIANTALDRLGEPIGLRIDTGFNRLDNILEGMWGGNLIIVGARPAVGKTSFALAMAENAAKHRHKVLFYSLEMLYDELFERYICKNGRVQLNRIIKKEMDDSETYRYVHACEGLSELPITVLDRPDITVQDIRAEARTTADVDVIFVDHIGLLKATGKYQNRNLELGAISRELKNLAAELRIPIVVMAQLNRGRQETDEPQLNDLRDSGELEQNASKVIMIWKKDVEDNIRGVKVAKNRRGANGTVFMRFEGEYMTFTEIDENAENMMQEMEKQKRSRRDSYDEL